jgi:hypothetical protein
MNSDDDDALEDVKPDEEKGMYTPEMDPKKGPVKLTRRKDRLLHEKQQPRC